MYYPESQIPSSQRGQPQFSVYQGDFANIQNQATLGSARQNKNLTSFAYSTIDPVNQKEQWLSMEGSLPFGGTFTNKDSLGSKGGNRPAIVTMDQGSGSQLGFTALFGPQDFQLPPRSNPDYKPVTGASVHNEPRVNFRDRYAQASGMDSRIEDRAGDQDIRGQGGLKSSMKYSKPPCLQNTSALGMSMTGRPGASFALQNRTGQTMILGDHDDLKLKLDHLAQKFLEKHREKDAFKDTFFDEEIFAEEMKTRNYFKLSLDLLKYALHSANQPKKKKEEKKAGGFAMGRR